MSLVEKLSKGITEFIVNQTNGDEEKKEIIEYGAFCLIQTLWGILVAIVFAIIFNVLIESLVIGFTVYVLRKYSGGVHASSPNRCAVIGAVIFVVLSKIAIQMNLLLNIKLIILIGIISFLYCYYIINKLAPVDSPAKPILKKEKRKALKKQSIKVLYFMYIVSMLLVIAEIKYNIKSMSIYISCIYLAGIWQASSLTSIAHILLRKVEFVFIKITSLFCLHRKNN